MSNMWNEEAATTEIDEGVTAERRGLIDHLLDQIIGQSKMRAESISILYDRLGPVMYVDLRPAPDKGRGGESQSPQAFEPGSLTQRLGLALEDSVRQNRQLQDIMSRLEL